MLNNIIIFLIYTRHKWRINYWNKKRNFGNNKTNEKGEKTMMLNIKKEKINNNRNNFNCFSNYDCTKLLPQWSKVRVCNVNK